MNKIKISLISILGIIIIAVTLCLTQYKMTASAANSNMAEKPLITFSCITDLHNQGPIITGEDYEHVVCLRLYKYGI